jgi:hypothetical protein
MGRYTKAYSGTLALVCAGSIAVAVYANGKAAKLGVLDASAQRWQTWARNEHGRDERTYARYAEIARRYQTLTHQVAVSQRRLQREIAATRSLHRTVIVGSPVVSYVRVRKLVPVAAVPATGAATPAKPQAPPPGTATKQKPLSPTQPMTPTKPGSAPVATTPAAPGPGGAPAPATPGSPSTPADPGSPAPGTTPGTTPGTPPPANTTTTGGGAAPPPPLAAPVNTALPSITGVPQSSKTVSAAPGSWTGAPTSFQYQWQRCDASGGACVVVGSGASYTCVPQDIDKTLRVAVQAANAAGSAVAVSAASPQTKPS